MFVTIYTTKPFNLDRQIKFMSKLAPESHRHLKQNFSVILGGAILIGWGGFVSGMPDDYIYSFFGIDESYKSVHQLQDMGIDSWTDRLLAEIWIIFVLFSFNYLITAAGIVLATVGGILTIREMTSAKTKS